MIEFLVEFLTAASWQTVVFVFVAKVFEVTLSTLRLIIVNRGFKLEGAIVSFVEVLIWVFVATEVVNDVRTAPLLGIIYALGFSVGVYVGSMVEKKMAFGMVMLNIIVPIENAGTLEKFIRDKKIGLTTFEAHGLKSNKVVMMLYTNRKNLNELKAGIRLIEPHALVAENDVVKLTGGSVPKKQRLIK